MNRLRYFILTGIFYGYSKEAIHAFIMRCCDVDMGNESEFTPTSTGTQFEHMGFIPSARELAMTVEEVTSDVNSRRICKASFPYDGAFDVEFAAFTENPPEDIEDRIYRRILMNHICVLTLNGGAEVTYQLDELNKSRLVLEFRGTDLSEIASAAMLKLGAVKPLPASAKKKQMVVVATRVLNQTLDHLKNRPEATLLLTGDVGAEWRVYNVPEFNLYDQTIKV